MPGPPSPSSHSFSRDPTQNTETGHPTAAPPKYIATMAIFSFSKDSKEEKSDSPREVPEYATAGGYTSEEGVVDEAEDDLHRGMKPRQLSEFLVVPMPRSAAQHARRAVELTVFSAPQT